MDVFVSGIIGVERQYTMSFYKNIRRYTFSLIKEDFFLHRSFKKSSRDEVDALTSISKNLSDVLQT